MSENQSVESKSTWRDEYLKWICGFANAQGGVLEIGKDNSGRVFHPDPEAFFTGRTSRSAISEATATYGSAT